MERNSSNTFSRLRILVISATIISGFLAGGNIDRYIVQVPAFGHIGILCWAQYSLHADLGNGIFLYPFETVVSFLLLVVALVIILSNRALLKPALLPIVFASVFAFFGLFFTAFAAPVMLGIGNISNDPVLLHKAFDRFHFWGMARAISQVLSFCACVFGMARVFVSQPKNS